MKYMTDPRCGKVSVANDRDGHCTKCHRTFSGEEAFTAHHRHVGDELVCEDPRTAPGRPKGSLKYGPRDRPGTTDGVAWGLGPSGAFLGGKPWES